MKEKFAFCVLYALAVIFLAEVNCITVTESVENVTTTMASVLERNDTALSLEVTSEKSSQEARTITEENDDKSPDIHKIPPTLQNAKKADAKPEKALKDIAKPAPVHAVSALPDGKLKQAIINSKQQSFKHLVDKTTGRLKDQIARPAENQPDISKELPPPPEPQAKHFFPSPELSPFIGRENQQRDHFHPLAQFMRPPAKDARFPFETNGEIEQRWFGGNRLPNEIHPNEVSPGLIQQHGMLRNTHVEFPHHHTDRHAHYHLHHKPPKHSQEEEQQQQQQNPPVGTFFGGSSERMVFPNEVNPFSEEFRNNWPSKLPDLNKQERAKGIWKWIPDNGGESESPETRFNSFYDTPQRPHTVHDRPYTFESSDVFGHHTTPPTGPGNGYPWATAEALVTGEEVISTAGKTDESERTSHLDVKLLKRPSPWKKLIHVMAAALPLGLIISALTPRIVYVHPNATAPTLQPPFSQQQPPPPFPPSGPNQPQQQNNAPLPLRQRAIIAPTYDISTSLAEFMRFMERQYREQGGGVDGACEDRFFCEMALMGAHHNANAMHRTMYRVALETSQTQAEKSGLREIFAAIKRHDCNTFKCKRVS